MQQDQYSKLPTSPALNGGLYTGAPFLDGAPWRNYPARPETGNMIYNNLRKMNVPPDQALYHFPGGGIRPGNNTPELPPEYISSLGQNIGLNRMCVPKDVQSRARKPTPMFSTNEYLL
jgi:hypothetical protein